MAKSSVSREELFVGNGKFSLDFSFTECKDQPWKHRFKGKVAEIPCELQEHLGVRSPEFYLAVLYSVQSVAASKAIGNKVEVTVDGEVKFHVNDLGGSVTFSL